MSGCQIKIFTGGSGGLDQSQAFPKFDFPTWGEGTGGQDVWDKFPNLVFFHGMPKRADQLSKAFQTLPCLPINCLLNMFVLKIGGST